MRLVVWVNRYAGDYKKKESVGGVIGWVCLLMLIGYVLLNIFYPNNDVNLVLDAVLWVLGLYVVIKYARRSIVAIFTGASTAADFLVVGITISWLSRSGQAAGSIVTRLSSFDPAWLNSEYFGLVKLLAIFAAVCHVVPAGAVQIGDGESLPKQSRYGLGTAFLIAVCLSVYLVAKKPDLKPMIDNMPAWSRDMFQTGSRQPPDGTHG